MRRVVLFLFSLVIIQLSVSGCSWVMYAALQCKGGCTTTEENLTPLHEAAQTGDSVLVAKLMSQSHS